MFSVKGQQRNICNLLSGPKKSDKATNEFVAETNRVLDKLKSMPDFFPNKYTYFREAHIKRYPFSIVYFIDDKNKQIVVTSVFHVKRQPAKKFT